MAGSGPYIITIHGRDGRRLLTDRRVTAGGAFRFLRSRCRVLNGVEASTGYIHRADGSLYRRFGRQFNALTGAYRNTWGEVEMSGDEARSSFVREMSAATPSA